MPTVYYTLSVHPQCIEGVQWTKRGERFFIQEEHSAAFASFQSDGSVQEKMSHFLEAYQWHGQPVRFIIPTEEVAFRRLRFPFQDKKKISQVLPFEIENEVLEEAHAKNYQYLVQPQPDGSAQVLLLFARPAYLQQLIAAAHPYELLIQNVDCAAHALFQSARPLEEAGILFQIYLGAEEVFINVIENQMLHSVKTFPSRIPAYLQQHPDLTVLSPETLVQHILEGNAASDENQLPQGIEALREEIQALCGQFNLFLKTWQLKGTIQLSLHGLLGVTVAWNGQAFQLWGNPPQMASPASEPSDSQGRNLSAEQEKLGESSQAPLLPQSEAKAKIFSVLAPLAEFAPHWGILGELKKHGLRHLEGHALSFFSQGTPLMRFLKTYRWQLLLSTFFFLLTVGGFGGNYYLQFHLLQKEIQITEQHLQTRLKNLLPQRENLEPASAIAMLQANVAQKRDTHPEKFFHQRTYPYLSFLNKLSQALPDASLFNMKRLELSDTRFRVAGNAQRYEDLEVFKKNLEAFEEFQGKPVVPDYRKVKDQVFYTIIVNRSP